MSDPVRQLVEQHNQLRRLFKQVPRLEAHQSVLQRVYSICDLLLIHSRLEEEALYPVIGDLDPALAGEAEEAHRRAGALAAAICERKYWSNQEVKYDVAALERVVSSHARWEEDHVLPLVSALGTDDFNRMGRRLYERHQILLREYPDASGASAGTEGFSAGPLI
jgi:hemerythrin superfamily protein